MPPELLWLLLPLLLILLIRFRKLLPALFRLLLRTGAGYLFLVLFSAVSPYFGLTLGANPVNAAVLGVLGVPGFGLLLMLRYLTL